MKVIEISRSFGIENLRLVTRHEPEVLSPQHVLVQMKAASLNYRDYLVITGKYNPKFKLPLIPLSDGAGEIIAVGNDVQGFSVGDRVISTFAEDWQEGEGKNEEIRNALGGPKDGTLCEKKVFHSKSLVKIPDYLSYEEAATLPCAALTAWNSFKEFGNLSTGQTVLIQGTGGVSLFGLQIGKALGARIIATSSSEEKLQKLKDLGAIDTINYKEFPEWGKIVKEKTGGIGVDHVLEVGGLGTLEQSIKATRPFGQISLIGVLSGNDKPVNLLPVIMNNIKLQGILVGSKMSLVRLCSSFENWKIKPVIDRVFNIDEAIKAIEYLKSGNHFGKIVIKI
ncbi:MAG: NAD(P)-dependent alcohol dehydrogenase [Leptospiraceae bacterium]|nr:NAD(P)-dependent alcohol dehydrogenase [Leptospiraceae bacterium]